MKFGPISIGEAKGAILAHTLVLADGRLKKGHHLSDADIERLRTNKIETVTVAQLETGDIEENAAAQRIASSLVSQHVTAADPFTGRVNLYASCAGVFFASKDGVDNINRISPSITLATLPNGEYVEAGRMVATVKIIPFAVEGRAVGLVEQESFRAGILTVRASSPKKIGLVSTVLPSLKPATMDKTKRVLEARLAASGSELIEEIRVPHTSVAVAEALQQLEPKCDLIVLFGASAISDRADIIPAGLELAGGTVATFGMPVDPGNLLLTGDIHGKPVIGAPGCARSPALNGFDWVLHRMLAGMNVDQDYISGLGVGGLLMEITSRPQPRDGTDTDD